MSPTITEASGSVGTNLGQSIMGESTAINEKLAAHGASPSHRRPPISRQGTAEAFNKIELQPAYCPPHKTLYDHIPPLYALRPLIRYMFRMTRTEQEERIAELKKQRKKRLAMETNVPLELGLHISTYIAHLNKNGFVDAMYTSQVRFSSICFARKSSKTCTAPRGAQHVQRLVPEPRAHSHNASAVRLRRAPEFGAYLLFAA